MNEVAVVIPVYKSVPSDSELRSFIQCLTVLECFPIVLVTPNGLDTSLYHKYIGDRVQLSSIHFDEKYFSSIKGYSELLLSKEFYQQFISYRYILIYQLDAWVFNNELLSWCTLNMDYIGAPWLEAPPISSNKKPVINFTHLLKKRVGNGGFSLRKVKSHLKWTWWTSLIFRFFPKNEDVIWTLFVPFKRPSCLKSLSFAFEMNPERSFELNGKKLPFGCHAWEKYNPAFWAKFIPGASYAQKEP